jgi:DNA modification methylase
MSTPKDLANIQTQMLPISAITTNRAQIEGLPANPRVIRDGNFKKLKQSITERPGFLALREILVFKHGGKYVIIGGNMRYRACKELGYTEVPCKVIPEGTTLEELRAYCLIDNSSYGEWDMEALANEWDAALLEACAIDIPDVETPSEDEVENVDEDNADPTPPTAPKTLPGDIYQLGDHRLVCGDSTDPRVLETLMKGETADVWITDQPYNVDYKGKAGKIQNDNMAETAFLDFLTKAFTTARDVLKPGGAFYIWHADGHGLTFRQAVDNAGLLLKQNLIWVKNSLVLGRQDYQWMHEPCLYGWRDGAAHYFTPSMTLSTVMEQGELDIDAMTKDELKTALKNILQGDVQTTVIREDKPLRSELHPTMKPVRLIARQIVNSTRRGEIVLDTFGGSGTTLIASEQLARRCRMTELDPGYADVIVRRWEDLTHQQAVLVGNLNDALNSVKKHE